MIEPYLTSDQLAARWGLKPSTIRGQRRHGLGPAYYTISRVRYPLSQVLAFEEANSITPLN
jgi:hypothetical protein